MDRFAESANKVAKTLTYTFKANQENIDIYPYIKTGDITEGSVDWGTAKYAKFGNYSRADKNTTTTWQTVTIDNATLKAYLLEGKDLSSVQLLYLSFLFPNGQAQNIYIDNMHLEDHTYGTDEQDAIKIASVSKSIIFFIFRLLYVYTMITPLCDITGALL